MNSRDHGLSSGKLENFSRSHDFNITVAAMEYSRNPAVRGMSLDGNDRFVMPGADGPIIIVFVLNERRRSPIVNLNKRGAQNRTSTRQQNRRTHFHLLSQLERNPRAKSSEQKN